MKKLSKGPFVFKRRKEKKGEVLLFRKKIAKTKTKVIKYIKTRKSKKIYLINLRFRVESLDIFIFI